MSRKQIIFFMLFCAFAAVAEEIPSTLSNFTSGTTISSSTMNAHFDAVETAVDDNASDIDALQALDTVAEMESSEAINIILETEMDASSELRALIDDETGTGAIVFAGGAIGAATATTASSGDNDTSVATTAFVQAELATKSAASSTNNAIARFDATSGDIQDSGVTIDDSNNLTVPGSVTAGGTEVPTCIILRDSDDGGDSACSVLNGTFSCETDTNGVCDDAT